MGLPTRLLAAVPAGLRYPLAVVALTALVISLPFWPPFRPDFRVTQLQLAASLVIIVLGVNLVVGYSGQISLGHSGFALFGGYVLAILVTKGLLGQDVPAVVALVAAAVLSGALGFAIGVPALRLSGPYLAIVTLAFALAVPVVLRWDGVFDITGGSQGILGIDQPNEPEWLRDLRWFNVNTARWRYFVIALPAVAAAVVAWNLMRSRFGRALVAIRDNELAAEQMGVNVALHKTLAFGISAAYAGLGGALFVYASLGVISPDAYGLIDNINYLVAIVVGGIATISGAIIGAVFIAYQAEIADWFLGDTWTVALGSHQLFSVPSVFRAIERPEALRPAVTGVLLIAVVLLAPRGLAGAIGRLASWRPRGPRGPRGPRDDG